MARNSFRNDSSEATFCRSLTSWAARSSVGRKPSAWNRPDAARGLVGPKLLAKSGPALPLPKLYPAPAAMATKNSSRKRA